jgi:hypothetical protein
MEAALTDTKLLKARYIYSLVTMISEVSGWADIFVVTLTFLLGKFYTPLCLDTSIAKKVAPVRFPGHNASFRMPKSLDAEYGGKFDINQIFAISRYLASYHKLSLNLWLIISQPWCPKRYRAKRSKVLIKLKNRGF